MTDQNFKQMWMFNENILAKWSPGTQMAWCFGTLYVDTKTAWHVWNAGVNMDKMNMKFVCEMHNEMLGSTQMLEGEATVDYSVVRVQFVIPGVTTNHIM